MKKANVVIGAAFGDEGKGLLTDYFCRQFDGEATVVRFNGGAQAGHTVVTPEGDRHVFHHFGAGTLAGARTFLSRDFLVNPILWREEHDALQGRKLRLRLFIDREAPVTTIYDMLANQQDERARGDSPHGSCGMGIHRTVVRQKDAGLRLFAGDLFLPYTLMDKVAKIRNSYKYVCDTKSDYLCERFLADCELMRNHINLTDSRHLYDQKNIVFEGAQGLLLDAENEEFFPHVTCSRTGLTNVIPLAKDAGIEQLDVTYVTRSYMTRHGAGPFPGEDPDLKYADDTNAPNAWQGTLRFAPLDFDRIEAAIEQDLEDNFGEVTINSDLAITHVDQCAVKINANTWPLHYIGTGPTHKNVQRIDSHVSRSIR